MDSDFGCTTGGLQPDIFFTRSRSSEFAEMRMILATLCEHSAKKFLRKCLGVACRLDSVHRSQAQLVLGRPPVAVGGPPYIDSVTAGGLGRARSLACDRSCPAVIMEPKERSRGAG